MQHEGTQPTSPSVTDILKGVLAQGNEPETIECKEYVDPSDDKTFSWLLKAIGALANGETRGFVFIGVADKPKLTVVGLPEAVVRKFDNARINTKVGAYLSPAPRLDVHRLTYDGQEVVAIVVEPFNEIPVFVAQSFGDLAIGTVLVRTRAGESLPASKEADIRVLCERIVARHTDKVAKYLRAYSKPSSEPKSDLAEQSMAQHRLREVREFASEHSKGERPGIEVFFAPVVELGLGRDALKAAIPALCFDAASLQQKFPIRTGDVAELKSRGWIMVLPKPDPESNAVALYVWALHVSWAFMDYDRFWEDEDNRPIHGGVGLMHLTTRICLMLRFLRRLGVRYRLSQETRFVVGVSFRGSKGRYLASEWSFDNRRLPRCDEEGVAITRIASLADVSAIVPNRPGISRLALDMLEEAGWKLGRTDLHATAYPQAIMETAKQEPAVLFPESEGVDVYRS